MWSNCWSCPSIDSGIMQGVHIVTIEWFVGCEICRTPLQLDLGDFLHNQQCICRSLNWYFNSLYIGLAFTHVRQKVGSDFMSNLSPSIVFCSTSCLIATGEMSPIFLWNSSTVCTLIPIYALIFAAPWSSTQPTPWYWGILPIWIPFESLMQQVLFFNKIMKPAISHLL